MSESGAGSSGWPGSPLGILRTMLSTPGLGLSFCLSVWCQARPQSKYQMLVWSHQEPRVEPCYVPTALGMLMAGPGGDPLVSLPCAHEVCPAATCSLAPNLCAASQISLWMGPSSQPWRNVRSWRDGRGGMVMEGQSWRDGCGGTLCYFCGQHCFNLGTNQLTILLDFDF